MASSTVTYDVLVRHDVGETARAAAIGRLLRAAGLRPRLAGPSDRVTAAEQRATCRTELQVVGGETVIGEHPGPAGGVLWVDPGPPAPERPSLAALVRATMQQGEPETSRSLAPPALKTATVESYDLIAEQFAAQWIHHPPLRPLDRLLSLLPVPSAVLDAGCGPGHHSDYLARHGHDVVGVDLSRAMLTIARRHSRRAAFQLMDAQQLRYPNRTFDAVWTAAMPMHVPREEVPALLRGFRRVLRPGGLLGFNLQIGRRSEVVSRLGDRRFFEYYPNVEEVIQIITRAGFVVIDHDVEDTNRNTHDLPLVLRWLTVFACTAEGDALDVV